MVTVLEPPAPPRRPAPADAPTPSSSPHSGSPQPATIVDPLPRAPFPSARAQHDRAQVWVRVTLLIVVVALLIFSFALPIPGPRRDAASAERRFVEVRLVLAEIRAVLADFRADHGVWPGQRLDGLGDPTLLSDQLARPTGRHGAVLEGAQAGAGRERVLGPYTSGGVPANPVNGLSSVRFLRADELWPEDGDGLTGWIYRPATGEIRANLAGRAFPAAPRYVEL